MSFCFYFTWLLDRESIFVLVNLIVNTVKPRRLFVYGSVPTKTISAQPSFLTLPIPPSLSSTVCRKSGTHDWTVDTFLSPFLLDPSRGAWRRVRSLLGPVQVSSGTYVSDEQRPSDTGRPSPIVNKGGVRRVPSTPELWLSLRPGFLRLTPTVSWDEGNRKGEPSLDLPRDGVVVSL